MPKNEKNQGGCHTKKKGAQCKLLWRLWPGQSGVLRISPPGKKIEERWRTLRFPYMGVYRKLRPFNHIGGGDRILRAWKMQGRARGLRGERKTYHITIYHHITMEFGGYLLNVAKNPTRARARKGEAQGVLSYQKVTGIFDNPHTKKQSNHACKQWRATLADNSYSGSLYRSKACDIMWHYRRRCV